MKIDGGCHCGYITYAAEADPERTTICHCTDCQRLSGSAFRVVVRVAGDTFKITAGEPTIYVKTAESGARRVPLVPQLQIWSRSQLGWVTDLASIRRLEKQ